MAELTALESKIGEVLGLAMAAQNATQKVTKLVKDEGDHEDLAQTLQRMAQEAKETEERTTELASELEGKKTAILEKARETKQEAEEMARTYLGNDADGLDGLEFMTMAEAGEVGHLEILGTIARKAGAAEIQEFVEWAMPIQARHFEETRKGGLKLAEQEDPSDEA
jgi:hypothetical protein